VEAHTDGSNPSRSATNLVSETTKKLDLRRAGFARDFRPLSVVRFRIRHQRRFWAICGPSAPENLEWLFQWRGSLPADSDCVVDGSRARSVIPLPSALNAPKIEAGPNLSSPFGARLLTAPVMTRLYYGQ
jgi:hypothetical protein